MLHFQKMMGALSAVLLSLLVNISVSSADSQPNDDPVYFALSGGLSIADVWKIQYEWSGSCLRSWSDSFSRV